LSVQHQFKYGKKEKRLSLEDDPEQTWFNKLKFLFGKKTHFQDGSALAEEINDLMDEGQAKGFITDEESDMVHGVLDLKDTMAHSIMIPRTDISSASIDSTLGELIELVRSCGHTRIPIYRDNIDEIVGILHAKDLLKLFGEASTEKIPNGILRHPYFVPRNKKISELLRDLKLKKTHLAIVTDEYGGTAGIITVEDIIEEIVGEILDEHDFEPPLLSVIDDSSVMVDARLDIEKLEEHFEIELPEGEYESVGGFIINIIGKIPLIGEKIRFNDLDIVIKSADERKIDKVLITHKTLSSPAQEEGH
jgi:magnesium and cobalt transporter